ncbi:MAG: hypothetical protein KDC92_01220 [Bacteroidetes bacterium]|nr:hypothetical protein [Bacteroidota bacterium]
MSNIFEIDGDIEDNNDDERDENASSSSENNDSSTNDHDDLGVEIIIDDDDSAEEESSDSDDDVPWYDKVLSGESTTETNQNDSDDEEEGASIIFDEPEEETANQPEAEPVTEVEEETIAAVEESKDELESGLRIVSTENEAKDNEPIEEKPIASGVEEVIPVAKKDKPKPQPKEKPAPREETFDEIFPRKQRKPGQKSGWGAATWIFFILFLITAGLFGYFHFVAGHHAHDDKHAEGQHGHNQAIIDEKDEEIRRLAAELAAAKSGNTTESTSTGSNESTGDAVTPSKGTVYQIQISALRQYKPSHSNSSYKIFIDKNDGYTKFLVGAFASESDAMEFNEKLKQAGFDDTFIVKKVDGERVEYDPYK